MSTDKKDKDAGCGKCFACRLSKALESRDDAAIDALMKEAIGVFVASLALEPDNMEHAMMQPRARGIN